jgi:hypothetical protein
MKHRATSGQTGLNFDCKAISLKMATFISTAVITSNPHNWFFVSFCVSFLEIHKVLRIFLTRRRVNSKEMGTPFPSIWLNPFFRCSKTKKCQIFYINSVALSPQANYTDWATATCQRNLVPTFVDRRVSRGQRGGSPTVVNLSFLHRDILYTNSKIVSLF